MRCYLNTQNSYSTKSWIIPIIFPSFWTMGVFIRDGDILNLRTCVIKTDGFVNGVREWSSPYQWLGKPSFVLAEKIKALKIIWRNGMMMSLITLWIRKSLFLRSYFALMKKRLLGFYLSCREGEETWFCCWTGKNTLMEEISWGQKSQALWLTKGDKCTKFFHRVTNLIEGITHHWGAPLER